MLYKLLNFNNKKLGAYNLVFRYVKIRWHIFIALLYLSLIYIPVEILVIFSFKFGIINLLIFIPLLVMIILLLNLNLEAKSIVKQKYDITSEGFNWRTSSFNEYQVKLLVKYLKNDNLYSVNIVEKLIDLVYKEAEEKKYKGFIWPGVLLALLIPIWNQIVTTGFKNAIGTSELVNIITIFIISLIFIVFSLSMLKSTMENLSNDLFNEKFFVLKNLGKLLESVSLQVMIDEKLKV